MITVRSEKYLKFFNAIISVTTVLFTTPQKIVGGLAYFWPVIDRMKSVMNLVTVITTY